MRSRSLAVFLLAIPLAILLYPGVCMGKVVKSKRLEPVKVGGSGDNVVGGEFGTAKGFPGWRTKYDSRNESYSDNKIPKVVEKVVPGQFPTEKGTLVFWFYYDGAPANDNAERRWETLFSLADKDGKSFYHISIIPAPGFLDDRNGGAAKAIVHAGGDTHDLINTYAAAVVFDQKVPARRWSYVALTWGPDPAKDNRVYLNGVPASGYFEDYGMTRPLVPSIPMSTLFSKADAIHLGSGTGRYGGFYRGMLGDVEIHDEIITSYNFPPRGAPVIRSYSDDSFKVPGISGKLVAGDKVNMVLEGDPGGKAWVDFGEAKGIPLAEDPNAPGKYGGVFVIPPGLYVENGKVSAHLADESGFESEPFAGPGVVQIDARSRFSMTIDKTDLPADSSATARVKVKTTDANGNPVKDHQVKVTLSTTDEYTGLVGGGAARSWDAAAAAKDLLAGAEVESRWKGVTDSWGEVEFDFKSGFAAKSVILQAKDMSSGDVGVDYITSYKEVSIDIALTAPISRAAARRGAQYILKVEATRTELTADGRSRSVIRATLTDPNGVPVAGDPVAFTLSSPNGTLRTIQGTTDAAGVATSEYTAGKKIGIVVVTATATLRNATGNVSIILLADAPAKIYLKARPESLPADGTSRADLSVKVTDINDNPNKDTKVEFRVAKGGGKVEFPDRVTDRFGDTANRYTAGTAPGIATVLATVRSRVPTEAELTRARNVIFVPYSPDGEEIKVSRWLKRVGETAVRGEPIVEYTVGRNPEIRKIAAPYDCRVDFQYVEFWDIAQTGDTLAQISPVVVPGSTNPLPPVPAMAPRRR